MFISNKQNKLNKIRKKRYLLFKLKKEIVSRNEHIKSERSYKSRPLNLKPKHWLYDSKEWKRLRYEVLREYGFKCMACKCSDVEIHVDHIKPVSKNPDLAFVKSNLQVLCKDCNEGKSNLFEDNLKISGDIITRL